MKVNRFEKKGTQLSLFPEEITHTPQSCLREPFLPLAVMDTASVADSIFNGIDDWKSSVL